jgi:hypothetical protein
LPAAIATENMLPVFSDAESIVVAIEVEALSVEQAFCGSRHALEITVRIAVCAPVATPNWDFAINCSQTS